MPITQESLGEIIGRSFGDQINYDDLTDPDVAHLKLWERSPSPFHAQEYARMREFQRSRTHIRGIFAVWDTRRPNELSPYTDNYVHHSWLEAIKYDPRTFELIEDAPPELLAELRAMPLLGDNTGAPMSDAERWAYQPKYVPPPLTQETRSRIGDLLENREKPQTGELLKFPGVASIPGEAR